MRASSVPLQNAANLLPPEGPPPRRRFLLGIPGRPGNVELKQLQRVDRADGWDFYLGIDGDLEGPSPDLTPPEGASSERPRRFFLLLSNGGKFELRASVTSIGADGTDYFLAADNYAVLRNAVTNLPPEGPPPRRRFFLHVPGRRDSVELKYLQHVDKVDGWDFYLAINGDLGEALLDPTPPEGASSGHPRRFFLLLSNGGKFELRESGRSISAVGTDYFVSSDDYSALRNATMNLTVPSGATPMGVSE